MANNGELLISSADGIHQVKVSGRATFECAPPLRDLAKKIEEESFSKIQIDLGACEWMDSTFMGVLAMLGLNARKKAAIMEICAANQQNRALLEGLGLKKLFSFTDSSIAIDGQWQSGATRDVQQKKGAETVLEAHKTLMSIDEQNVPKFEKIVDLVEKDVERLKGK